MNPFEQWLPLYGPGVVAERPWWRPVYQERGDGTRYLIAWRRPDGVTVHDIEVRQAIIDVRAEHDRLNPMPPPPPMCGQVWAQDNGMSTMVTSARPLEGKDGGWAIRNGGFDHEIYVATHNIRPVGISPVFVWPLLGRVLVAGPTPYGRDVPWAPGPATQTKAESG